MPAIGPSLVAAAPQPAVTPYPPPPLLYSPLADPPLDLSLPIELPYEWAAMDTDEGAWQKLQASTVALYGESTAPFPPVFEDQHPLNQLLLHTKLTNDVNRLNTVRAADTRHAAHALRAAEATFAADHPQYVALTGRKDALIKETLAARYAARKALYEHLTTLSTHADEVQATPGGWPALFKWMRVPPGMT